ncbi:ORC/CDC6 like AAA ATPase [Cryptosporidium canis]|uniref:ORC/CDC6 like AAA ATPase n=1 Tax=Cryptosporidium canis TaxID=195482 RepID=A0ABQ8PCE8_9CRYT|nr:ORC/CDC6 like AAA ATPase [Cryptosporidium canis]KAJ1615451.1 ORC/CDC6 like AAA ATPase [Cryptosporidium canis]
MSTRRKRCRFHDNSSGEEDASGSTQSFADNKQLKESDVIKIIKRLKSEPHADWDFLGRVNEFREISDYLKGCILNSSSGIVYISGSPGTGKTCTVDRILNTLENDPSRKLGYAKPANYKIIRTNASKVATRLNKSSGHSNGAALFVHLLELMKFQVRTVEEFKKINKNEGLQESAIYFIKQLSKKRTKYIAFIDEIDLVSSGRNSGDTILELFKTVMSFPESGLVLITVSNTVQIGNEIVKKVGVKLRNSGRIKLMVFPPYSYGTLRDIVLQRINLVNGVNDDPIFNKAGIELCVRKVASVYGDCRRTLDACYLTLGKFVFDNQNLSQKEQSSSEDEDIGPNQLDDLSNVSTRENSPVSNRGPLNREADSISRLRTRSMPANISVPIHNFQNVMGRIHQSDQGRLQIIKTLPLHQQYVIMGIILAIVEEQIQSKEASYKNFIIEQGASSLSKITNTRISVSQSKRKYHQICEELMTLPEEHREMLDALESSNIISTFNEPGGTKRRSSSFHRGATRSHSLRDPKIELLFSPEQIMNALSSLPRLGPIFSSLLYR